MFFASPLITTSIISSVIGALLFNALDLIGSIVHPIVHNGSAGNAERYLQGHIQVHVHHSRGT